MIRIFFLILFIISAIVVYIQKDELIYGIEGYITGKGNLIEVRKVSDLKLPERSGIGMAKIMGIPDYASTCPVLDGDQAYTCFRMIDFSNRLAICSQKGLKAPEGIDEVIKPRILKGRLVKLQRMAFDKDLRRCLKRSSNISLSRNTLVLLEGQSSLPSIEKLAILGGCLLLSCFSLYRVIKP